MNRTLVWSFLAFALFGFAAWAITSEYFSSRERDRSTFGWITDHHSTASSHSYDYAFIWNTDTCTGSNIGPLLKGCEYGYRDCIGRRFRVDFSSDDCSNSRMDFDDEEK